LAIVGYQALHLGVFATIAGTSISKPKDRITTLIVKHMNLERGAALGLSMFAAGAVYAAYLLTQWASSGFTDFPHAQERYNWIYRDCTRRTDRVLLVLHQHDQWSTVIDPGSRYTAGWKERAERS